MTLLFLSTVIGCSSVKETAKVLWGSSTKALEEAREEAVSKVLNCPYEDCYEAVLKIFRKEKEVSEDSTPGAVTSLLENAELIPSATQPFHIFLNDPIKGVIVVMGIPGNVDTTEVGIFLTKLNNRVTRIEIASLSTSAKMKVADIVFNALTPQYPEWK